MEQVMREVERPEQAKKKVELELALKEFGLELKRVRENKGLKQFELAELTRIDKTVISELERGLYTPSLVMIGQLSEGLEINPHVLLAAYYGIPLPEFNQRDKETLESFIKLALDYVAPKTAEPLPFHSKTPTEPITEKGKEGLKKGIAENRRRSNARKKAETPNDIES